MIFTSDAEKWERDWQVLALNGLLYSELVLITRLSLIPYKHCIPQYWARYQKKTNVGSRSDTKYYALLQGNDLCFRSFYNYDLRLTAPKGATTVNQTSGTDWQMELRRDVNVNVNSLIHINYFSNKKLPNCPPEAGCTPFQNLTV